MWSNAKIYFKNLDKLFNHINSNPDKYNGMQFIYSSPQDYIGAINKLNVTYPTNQYDFMPYASGDHDMWSGYFTSRVADKSQVKKTGRWA